MHSIPYEGLLYIVAHVSREWNSQVICLSGVYNLFFYKRRKSFLSCIILQCSSVVGSLSCIRKAWPQQSRIPLVPPVRPGGVLGPRGKESGGGASCSSTPLDGSVRRSAEPLPPTTYSTICRQLSSADLVNNHLAGYEDPIRWYTNSTDALLSSRETKHLRDVYNS